jgi:hypothetical protein
MTADRSTNAQLEIENQVFILLLLMYLFVDLLFYVGQVVFDRSIECCHSRHRRSRMYKKTYSLIIYYLLIYIFVANLERFVDLQVNAVDSLSVQMELIKK